jgi:hypothetical protein
MMALKGTKPGEMPVVLPVKDFVRNLEVGRSLEEDGGYQESSGNPVAVVKASRVLNT